MARREEDARGRADPTPTEAADVEEAPSGKTDMTEIDRELPDDQSEFQTDTS